MFKKIIKATQWINLGSAVLALMLPAVILATFPGVLIDIFVMISVLTALMLLIITLENDQPLRITFLPTIILLLTTFRLLLSIATTRNILANNDVGMVIESIGQLVMGAGLLSGLIVFCIITIVQFLVVTKGGERVAEVGARFSLDALPGRQMTIDGDLKNNMITPEQAQILRAELSTENKLFGSLEGAMKFIKGDAIAGVMIILVNFFGGIYVGINQFELSLAESVKRFSILTIGDGLVSQIPSLLLSVACGVYLTRIKGVDEPSSSFVGQIKRQVGHFWKSLLILGVVMFVIGITDRELMWLCIAMAVLCILCAFLMRKENHGGTTVIKEGKGDGIFGTVKFILNDAKHKDMINIAIGEIEQIVWGENLGSPEIEIDNKSEEDITVWIMGIRVYGFSMKNSGNLVEILDDEIAYKSDKISDNIKNIAHYFLRSRFIEKYNIQITNNILEGLAKVSSVMNKEVDSAIGINRVHDVLKQKIICSEFILDKETFFEELIYWSRMESDPSNWLTRIRGKAKYEITSKLLGGRNKIYPVVFSSELTEKIESINEGVIEDYEIVRNVRKTIRDEVKKIIIENKVTPIIIVSDEEVNNIKSFMSNVMSTISVCGYSDLVSPEVVSEPQMIMLQD